VKSVLVKVRLPDSRQPMRPGDWLGMRTMREDVRRSLGFASAVLRERTEDGARHCLEL